MRIDAAAYQFMSSICDGRLCSFANRATEQNADTSPCFCCAGRNPSSVLFALSERSLLLALGPWVREREGVLSFVNHRCKVPPNFLSHSTNGILSHHARRSHLRGDDVGHPVVQLPNLPKRGQVLPSPVRPPASCASGVMP